MHGEPTFTCLIRNGELRFGKVKFSFTCKRGIRIETQRKLSVRSKEHLIKVSSRMFSLNEDLSRFHVMCNKHKHLKLVAKIGAGNLLKSPTVFEDVVKTICTTNCSWANTKLMCQRLCSLADGYFPSAEQIIRVGLQELKEYVRAGYRAEYIYEFAERITSSEINPEAWPTMVRDIRRNEIASIRGVGAYALNHILFLIGDYSQIPIDSEVTKWMSDNVFTKIKASENNINKYYSNYGEWKFLAYKFSRILQ